MLGRAGADFSFSGLKTAVRQIVQEEKFDARDLAASFQAAVVDVLCDRARHAMAMFARDFPSTEFSGFGPDGPGRDFVLAGGVASNAAIRAALTALGEREGFQTKIPPPGLCTDNAAMVAWAGVERGQLGLFDGLGTSPKARWPLDAPWGEEPARPIP
jgi:N6-L-threonylcarbamoyladenine synthase